MTTLYLIRHAEAEGNLFRRFHGHMDSMITPNGMKQIYALAKRFSEIPVDLCYSSDLIRTMTTAQGVAIPNQIEIHPDSAFREVDFGSLDDSTFGYLEQHFFKEIECFRTRPEQWRYADIERFSDYTQRYMDRMEELAQNNPGKTVAIVSHAAITRGVLRRLFPELEILPSDNACVTKLLYDRGRYELEYQSDNSHYPPELSTIARNKAMAEGFSKTDNLFWYRPGAAELDGLNPPNGGEIFTVMAGEREAGLLILDEKDENIGILSYMGLLPYWRGRGRSVQLFGEAVYAFRKRGKQKMILHKPENGVLDHLCRQMELRSEAGGLVELDIRSRILAL